MVGGQQSTRSTVASRRTVPPRRRRRAARRSRSRRRPHARRAGAARRRGLMRDLVARPDACCRSTTVTVQAQWTLRADCIEGCARARHPRHLALARHACRPAAPERAAQLIRDAGPHRHRPLPRRHVHRGRRRRPPRRARRQPPRRRRGRRHRRAVPGAGGRRPAAGLDAISPTRAAQVRDGIAALLPYARQAGMPLAIEPLHPMYAADRACVNTLAQALDLCDAAGRGRRRRGRRLSRLVGPRPGAADRARRPAHPGLSRLRLAGADHRPAARPRHDGRRRDRPARDPRQVEAAGYTGHCEVEILSANNWWKRDPDEVLRVCIERHQKFV